jgi:tetratricopeptide (TPR) repeat protein
LPGALGTFFKYFCLRRRDFRRSQHARKASAHLFAGAVQERLGRRPQAISSFSKALREWPRAQSATFALAPLLLEAGQPEMAAELMDAAVAQPTVPDPLHDYWTGDADRWSRALERLREALR